MKKKRIIVSVILLICMITISGNSQQNIKESQNCPFLIGQSSKTFFFIPLDSIQIDRSSELSSEFSDSFFCQAANKLLFHFLSQKNSSVSLEPKELDSQITSLKQIFLTGKDTAAIKSSVNIIKEIVQKSGCELVMFPFSCSLQLKMQTQNGWRDGRGGPSYLRPVKTIAIARIQLLVWDKNGTLVCERTGIGKETKPMFYSFFGKRVKTTEIVSYSRKVYANPFIRALNEASRQSVKSKK